MTDNCRNLLMRLHGSMMGDAAFLPTGGAFLAMSKERYTAVMRNGLGAVDGDDDRDARDIYNRWHEGVHIAQLVTSPYILPRVYLLVSVALHACQHHRDKKGRSRGTLAELCSRYQSVSSALLDGTSGWTAEEVIETQAVTQGLSWMCPDSDGNSLRILANLFYENTRSKDKYLRLLNRLLEVAGDDAFFRVVPWLCFFALQTTDPGRSMALLIDKIRSETSITRICSYTPREFCSWLGLDVVFVTRSLRERAVDTHFASLLDHPWFNIFDMYFNELEEISDINDRLDLMMGVHGGKTHPFFAPLITVFGDGGVIFRGGVDAISVFAEPWAELTNDILEGLAVLKGDSRSGGEL